MKKVKSILPVALVLVMLLGMSALPAIAGETTYEPITISVALWDIPVLCESSDDFTKEDGQFYDPRWVVVAEKFNVRFEYVPLDYYTHQEKLRIMINGDDMPDVMISTLGIPEYHGYCQDELLTLLPEGYEEKYPNIKAQLDLIVQRDAYKYNGQYFAVPRAIESVEPYRDYFSSIYYRKDLAAAAGIEVKDYYTIQELYDMYAAVKAQNPDMVMFNHIWPDNMIQLGPVQAVPEIANPSSTFYFNPEKGEYVWSYADEDMKTGIEWFKKFYDAGFLDTEFFTNAFYEARNQFSANKLFSYMDGFDHLFYNQVRTLYLASNEGANVDDIIGYAYLLDNNGAMQAVESGNSWSEYIFRHDCDPKVVERFLTIYDYLLSEEGIMLCYFGREGIDWEIKDGSFVSLRKIDEATGQPIPFNKNIELVSDLVHPFMFGAMSDTRLSNIGTQYPDAVKDAINHYWSLRRNFEPLKVLSFDLDLALFSGDFYSKYSLKPVEAMYKIVFEEKLENVGTAWQKYLDDNAAQINNILNELNTNIAK